MTNATLVGEIASACDARRRCLSKGADFKAPADMWDARLADLADALPRGSGFDTEPVIDLDASGASVVIVNGSYHKMDANGSYDGWIDFKVTVRPSFVGGFDLTVRGNFGRDSGGHRDYIADTYCETFRADAPAFAVSK